MIIGNIKTISNSEIVQYIIKDNKILMNNVIPIFEEYPLLTTNKYKYELFIKSLKVIEDKYIVYEDKNKVLNNYKKDFDELDINNNMVNYIKCKDIDVSKEWVVGYSEVCGVFEVQGNQKDYTYNNSWEHLIYYKTSTNHVPFSNTINKIPFATYSYSSYKHNIHYLINYFNKTIKGINSLQFSL